MLNTATADGRRPASAPSHISTMIQRCGSMARTCQKRGVARANRMPDQNWKTLTESLTYDALVLRLKSQEHDFVERKPRNQKGDWLQAAVAFANSAPIGWPAVLFVGVDDAGTPQ